jgi:VWFA-related protein
MQWKRLLLLFVLTGTLLGQFRTRVDLVVVPVSVRDNNGFLVTALGRDDFKVLEDGKPQTITNFSIDPQPLSAAIVIDGGISGSALKSVIATLPSVGAAFTPDDEMTSFRYDHLVWRLSEFTSDTKQIEKSFEQLERISETRPPEPEAPALYGKIERKTPGWVKALANIFVLGSIGAPKSSASPEPAPRPKTPPTSRMMHTAIYDAAMALQNRPENHRKIILLISDGEVREPTVSLVPGKTLHSFDNNVDLLVKSEIQVFSIYTLADLLETSSGMLDRYARATGGDIYGGRGESNMEFAFRRITEQARTQYVVGYISSNTPPRLGAQRKIEVKSGDPDQKRKVVHRNGYFQYPIPQ